MNVKTTDSNQDSETFCFVNTQVQQKVVLKTHRVENRNYNEVLISYQNSILVVEDQNLVIIIVKVITLVTLSIILIETKDIVEIRRIARV